MAFSACSEVTLRGRKPKSGSLLPSGGAGESETAGLFVYGL